MLRHDGYSKTMNYLAGRWGFPYPVKLSILKGDAACCVSTSSKFNLVTDYGYHPHGQNLFNGP
jgi:hypothetical protein